MLYEIRKARAVNGPVLATVEAKDKSDAVHQWRQEVKDFTTSISVVPAPTTGLRSVDALRERVTPIPTPEVERALLLEALQASETRLERIKNAMSPGSSEDPIEGIERLLAVETAAHGAILRAIR